MKKRHVIKMIIAISLVMSMFLGGVFTAYAAEEINTVTVVNMPTLEDAVVELTVETPQAGMAVKDVKVTVSESEYYTLGEVRWYDESTFEEMESDDIFEALGSYFIEVSIEIKDGYTFDESVQVLMNGESYDDFYIYESGEMMVNAYYQFYGNIEKIELINVPEAKVGEKVSYEGIQVPEDAGYVIDTENTYWEDSMDGSPLEEGTLFENQHEYILVISVLPEAGNGFAEEVTVTVNGEEAEDYYVGMDYAEVYMTYSFLEEINKIEILEELPKAVVGEEIEEEIILTTPENAGYVVGAAWFIYDEGELEEVTGVFEEGKAYILITTAITEYGYGFANDVKVYANGKSVDSIYNMHFGGIYAIMDTQDLGENTIDMIEITMNEPKVGEEIKANSLKASEGANYEIGEAMWIDAETGEELTGKFEAGKKYELGFAILPLNGMIFGNNLVIKINGETIALEDCLENGFFTPVVLVAGVTYELSDEDTTDKDDIKDDADKDDIKDTTDKDDIKDDADKDDIKDTTDKDDIKDTTDKDNTVDKEESTTEKPDKAPETGDDAKPLLWVIIAIAALGCILILRKKKEDK